MKYRPHILTAVLTVSSCMVATAGALEQLSWAQVKYTEAKPLRQPIRPTFDSQIIDAAGGSFFFDSDAGTPQYLKDDLRIEFTIPPAALDDETEISLEVSGKELSDGLIQFAPAGLVFNHPATITISLGTDWLNLPLEQLEAVLHATGTGEREILGAKVLELNSSYFVVSMEVPGFSRYSLWHGRAKWSNSGFTWQDLIGGDIGNVVPNSRYSGGGGW